MALKKEVLSAWQHLRNTPLPCPSATTLVEIRADLANISTFGSGCANTLMQRGELAPGYRTVVLNCLDALQRVEGKIALVHFSEDGFDQEEIKGLLAYKDALERLLEAVLIGCDPLGSVNIS